MLECELGSQERRWPVEIATICRIQKSVELFKRLNIENYCLLVGLSRENPVGDTGAELTSCEAPSTLGLPAPGERDAVHR
jgi:hypothetical protein